MSDFLELLYRALTVPKGIVVETEDPEKLRMKLYALRKLDPQFEVLSFRISPINPASELWICRGKEDPYAASE